MKKEKRKTLKVLVCGSFGRMGMQIIRKINEDSRFSLAGAVDKNVSHETQVFHSEPPSSFEKFIKNADIAIDFTSPEASVRFAVAAASHKKPIVIGTTGFSETHLKIINNCSEKTPVFLSPNMSPAVNLIFSLAKLVAEKLGNFDVHITEAHHSMKKDSPSGTALRMARAIASGRKGEMPAISSVRAGDIVGDHTVLYAGPFERLEIIHRSHSRELFAHGALEAAYWLYGKKAGLYDYLDILGLKK